MNLRELSYELDNALKFVIQNTPSVTERKIVETYLTDISTMFTQPFPLQVNNRWYLLSIRSKFIHGRPYALFNSNGPCGKTKIELGDILFVAKYLDSHSIPIEIRASFLQAKLTKKNMWKITAHQQEFLMSPHRYKFKFGKKWDSGQQERRINSRSSWLFMYLLMSTQGIPNLATSPEIVELWRQKPCKDYTIPVDFFVPVIYSRTPQFSGFVWYNKFVSGGYALWLYKFLRKNGVGGYLVHNGKISNLELNDLVNTIYRFVGFLPDPPEEFEGYYGEGTFGIVEFTFAPSEDAMKQYKESRETT